MLLDEINLAAAETLECLSGLLESTAGSVVLTERGWLLRHDEDENDDHDDHDDDNDNDDDHDHDNDDDILPYESLLHWHFPM